MPGRSRLLLAMLVSAVVLIGLASPTAGAEAADSMDRFEVGYRADTAGVLHVTERISYRFGSDSGRHGIVRTLITREPDTDHRDTDILYDVSEPDVTSPDQGVDTGVEVETDKSDGGRLVRTSFRIGDPDKTISQPTATYVLRYTVKGAFRGSGNYDELYWDATGFENSGTIKETKITAEVPGGAQQVACFAGSPGSTEDCDRAVIDDGVARFGQGRLDAGEGVTIGAMVKPGLISDNRPHLEDAASDHNWVIIILLVIAGLIVVGVPVFGAIKIIKIGRDQRYLDLSPGSQPTTGQTSDIGTSPLRMEIPVRFEVPDLPVALAGLLGTGQVRGRDTAATLIQLAVRGAITIKKSGKGWLQRHQYDIRLQDATLAADDTEQALLVGIFGKKGRTYRFVDRQPRSRVPQARLQRSGRMINAQRQFAKALHRDAKRGRWFSGDVPKASGVGVGWMITIGIGLFLLAVSLMPGLTPGVLLAVPVLIIGLTGLAVRFRTRRGARSAVGRALVDQLVGFRKYLATAEAEQLRFEEGEDIYSRYLPWAIAYGLADRWSRVCQTLVDQGRIPTPEQNWYTGSGGFAHFNPGSFASGLSSATSTAGPTGSTGGPAGGSSGSAFGGGGFAGGGGGGGGTSSW